MIVAKSLYTQISELIDLKSGNIASKTVKYSSPSNTSNKDGFAATSSSTNDVVSAMAQLLGLIIEPRIITGFQVEATRIPSQQVLVRAGTGTAGGNYYTLDKDVVVSVDFSLLNSVYFVNVYFNGIKIEHKQGLNALTIAKIVVPYPGRSIVINDKKDDFGNAYIQSYIKYNFYGMNDKFEEDTIDLLRDNIGEVLADNLIGNLRLSENLKITNTSGTLELNSNSVNIKSSDDKLVAEFNEKGTYFYDDLGRLVAKFSVDGASIGSINISPSNIRSKNFISGNRGFSIESSGYAEFGDVKVRGRISSSVFEYDKVSAVGGKLLISNATVLSKSLLSSDTNITVDSNVFKIGDILYIKSGNDEEYLEITDVVSGGNIYNVNRNLASSESIPTWEKGTAIVSLGNNGAESGSELGGYLLLDSSSNYAPFIDVMYRNSALYNDVTTKVRLGRLDGITDELYGNLSGYGLYADNVFLRGKLYSPDIKTGIDGQRVELNVGGLSAYDNSEKCIFKILLNSESGIGDEGDIIIGNLNGDHLFWDNSSGILTFNGKGGVNLADRNYISDIIFSSLDRNTCEWTSGSILFSDGSSKSISAGNTGNIDEIAYVYYDDDVSQTNLQTTSDYTSAIGENKILLAIVEVGDSGSDDVTISLTRSRGTAISGNSITTGFINSARIASSSIVGYHIASSTITSDKLFVNSLSAISADLGTITAGNISGTTITGGTIQTASSGSRVVLNSNNLIAYDNASNEVFKILLSGSDVGDVVIGDYSNSKGIFWDKSGGIFSIKGAITATSGSFTGTVDVGTTAGRVYIDGANQCIVVKDEDGNVRVKLGKLS